MLQRELRGRKNQINEIDGSRRKILQQRIGYVKSCINKKYGVPLYSISLNWNTKHVSVKGQIVVKTCQDGSLKFSKYQDVEDEVDELMPKIGRQKTHRNDCEQSRKGVERRRRGKDYE